MDTKNSLVLGFGCFNIFELPCRFEINFKTGPSSNDDMAFQFNPRMDQKVAMNSVINGSWGTEESVSDNPFKKGEAFEMFTVIKSEGYQVSVLRSRLTALLKGS